MTNEHGDHGSRDHTGGEVRPGPMASADAATTATEADSGVASTRASDPVSPHKTLVYLEHSVGANFVWLVWALKPGHAQLAAVCSTEAKANRYIEYMPAHGGLSYQGSKMWKERVPLDHAFGWRDSVIAAAVTSKLRD